LPAYSAKPELAVRHSRSAYRIEPHVFTKRPPPNCARRWSLRGC